jgi:hypothetical protein
MKRPTPKVDKHIKYDADLAERIEKQAEFENKYFAEWVIEASRSRIESIDKASKTQEAKKNTSPESGTSVDISNSNLTLDEAERIIRDRIIPSIEGFKLVSSEDKDILLPLLRSARILLETIEINQRSRRRIELKPVTYLDPFEQIRQQGLKFARDRREKEERLEFLSALPRPIETADKAEPELFSASTNEVKTLTTNAALSTHTTYEDWKRLKDYYAELDKRHEKVKAEMKAQAKDSVKAVDESQEIPTEDYRDIQLSPVDGDDGVHNEDSENENIPQDF